MSQKKSRRSLNDDDAQSFVFGDTQIETTELVEIEPEPAKPAKKARTSPKPAKTPTQTTGDFMSQLLDKTADKEPTVRITVDLPQSTHQKLSMFCARTNTKKADIIRGLLNEALERLED